MDNKAITLNGISKKIGGRTLFEDVTLSFNPGKRYGLTGPNGSGKSTLLKIVIGIEEATTGVISLPKKVGFLKQNIEDFLQLRILDAVIMGNKRLWEALLERDILYGEDMTDAIGMRLGEIEEVIAEEDGYSAESSAEELLSGMGIPPSFHEQKMDSIPLDWQFRVLLCQALFGQPDALLLDEPTNHLDLESIGWLEHFLYNYQGALVVISHDRHFLNAVTTDIADIDYETVILYPGNYDQMLIAKTAVRERTEKENKSKDKKVSQLREFVARFGAGTRASQVQSRIREINRLQPQELKKSNIQRPYIRFGNPTHPSGKVVFKIEHLSKGFDSKEVIKDFSLEILKDEKIAVVGNNGRGKTTLLKLCTHLITPDRGIVEWGHQVQIGYFPQNHSEVIDKREEVTAFDWLKSRRPGIYDQEIRGALGKMLFSGEDAFKLIRTLSGGETARLIFASLMLSDINVLVLDEPNNHLDLESVSALAWGVSDFKGTVVVASHDRQLVDEVATKIIAIEEKGIRVLEGTLDEYLTTKASLS